MAAKNDAWLERRAALMSRLETSSRKWPDGRSPAYVKEVSDIAQGLHALAEAADAAGKALEERVRTWRFAGDAFADLVVDNNAAQWEPAARAYENADALLKGIDAPVERMKLDFRYGRALFGLSRSRDAVVVAAARSRFLSALELAKTYMPEAVADVKGAVADTDRVLAILGRVSELDMQTARLREELAAAPDEPSAESAFPPEFQAIFGELRRNYEAESKTGKVSAQRQQALNPILDEIAGMLGETTRGAAVGGTRREELEAQLAQVTARGSRLRELKARLEPMLARTGDTDAATASETTASTAAARASAVWDRFSVLKMYLVEDVARPHLGIETQMAGMDLYRRCAQADTFIHNPANDDASLRAYEHNVLRPLALDVRRYSLREHLLLAQPEWRSPPVAQDASGIAYVGGPELRQRVAAACDGLGLALLDAKRTKSPAAARLEQLRACHVAVFDYTGSPGSTRSGTADLATAAPVAVVSHALGMALALGRPAVIVANEGQGLPFDVDIPPVCMDGGTDDDERLAAALDDILYGLQRGGGDALAATHAYVKERFAAHPSLLVRQSLKMVDDEAIGDAVKLRRVVEPLLGAAGADAPLIVFPAWPGSYPSAQQPRLFHVTPFGPAWASQTRTVVAEACARSSPTVTYVRGDEVLQPDIINSIWNELCTATHVLVDLTGLNANVALELGIAQVLGRNTLVISQDDPADVHVPALAKQRSHRYGLRDEDDVRTLRKTIAAFLAEKQNAGG